MKEGSSGRLAQAESVEEDVASTFDPFVPPTAGTGAVAAEDEDPFHVGSLTARAKARDIIHKKQVEAEANFSSNKSAAGSTALPPRLDVKFMTHEEASSVAPGESSNEGASDVFVEGTVLVSMRLPADLSGLTFY